MAVRMLGRDCRDNGHVEYKNARGQDAAAPRRAHLEDLLPMADDPDAGVRRELILALRNLPTDKVGDALRKLAASWDGQDRWYLEALGLALEKRERPFLAELFDGTLYGDLDLERCGPGRQGRAAAVFPGRPQRGVHRRRHAGPAGDGAEQVRSAWPGGSIAARCCRCSSGSSPYLRTPELQQAGRRHPRADEGPGRRPSVVADW